MGTMSAFREITCVEGNPATGTVPEKAGFIGSAGGSPVGGAVVAGNAVAGDAVAGDAVAGDAAAGNAVAGDAAAGDATGLDMSDDPPVPVGSPKGAATLGS